jgi:cobalt-zinc-cadmium efflux system protein
MSHDHDGAQARSVGQVRRLAVALALIAGFMVVEFVGAVLSGSLALMSDAGHMATDALGLGMALAASVAAERASADTRRTYGLYRLEILAALANAVLLLAVAGYVVFEAVGRFGNPPEVMTGSMLAIALVGLVVNLVAWRVLSGGRSRPLNLEAASLEVVADTIGSVALVAAAVTITLTDWWIVDPVLGAAVGLYVVPRAVRIGRRAIAILVEAAPRRVDVTMVGDQLAEIPGVIDVHDLHVWSLTSEMDIATAHLMTTAETDPHAVLDRARAMLQANHGIAHATLQVEPETHTGCSEVRW